MCVWYEDAIIKSEVFKFEDAGAYLLGVDLGPLLNEQEAALLTAFIAKGQDPHDPDNTLQRLTTLSSNHWDDPDESERLIITRFEAIALGFASR